METPMDNWNDERLDELSGRVDEGFKETRQGFARVDREMREGFARVDREMKEGFARVDERFEKVATKEELGEVKFEMGRLNERFDRLLNSLALIAWGFAGTTVAALAAVLVAALAS